jgi:hypothetical protein
MRGCWQRFFQPYASNLRCYNNNERSAERRHIKCLSWAKQTHSGFFDLGVVAVTFAVATEGEEVVEVVGVWLLLIFFGVDGFGVVFSLTSASSIWTLALACLTALLRRSYSELRRHSRSTSSELTRRVLVCIAFSSDARIFGILCLCVGKP